MHARAGVAEGVQAFVRRVVGALQVLQVLDGFEVVDFVFHVAADGFPMADREWQARALEFEAGEGFAVVETDAHAVLAVDAVLGRALGFDDPGGERFPWDEHGSVAPAGMKQTSRRWRLKRVGMMEARFLWVWCQTARPMSKMKEPAINSFS